MAPSEDIVVFGIASSGVVDQWDGHVSPIGILLRWFAPARPGLSEFPELGFDVYRAQLTDVPPLPFNDLNIPVVQDKTSWTYANQITLSSSSGLRFARSSQSGWWRLTISPGQPVIIRFSGPAWFVTIRADSGTSNLSVVGKVAGAPVRQEILARPGAILTWRTRGVNELELSGEGSVSIIGYRLLDDTAAWQHIVHRCLPIIDPRYLCGPQPGGTEADEAQKRLPPNVRAQWTTRFDPMFQNLLPALRRLATGARSAPIPPDANFVAPHPNSAGLRLTADEQKVITLSTLDPHGARILGLAYDDPLAGALDGREYVYKVVGRWLGKPVTVDLSDGTISLNNLRKQYGVILDLGKPSNPLRQIVITFTHPAHDFLTELKTSSVIRWVATNRDGKTTQGEISTTSALKFSALSELRLSGTGIQPNVLSSISWTPSIDRFGLLPGIAAVEPGPPPGPPSLTVKVIAADSTSATATAELDWPIKINGDGATPEGEPVSYQIGRRRFGKDPATPTPSPTPAKQADLVHDGSPIFVSATHALKPLGERVLFSDRNNGLGLELGWWGWWIRGVDLFGRVSSPSPWALAPVRDTSNPAAPVMVQAEWVQPAVPQSTMAVMGRSSEATRWLEATSPDAHAGLVASWAFGPDQAELHPDVDGFQLLVRRPALPVGGLTDAPVEYREPWPDPVMSVGPISIKSKGIVTRSPAPDPIFMVIISLVQTLAAAPNAKGTDPVRSACVTNLALDGASGVFVGGRLHIGGSSYAVVASGDGPDLTVVVEHPPGPGPVMGPAELQAPTKRLIEITTDLPALTPPLYVRCRSGVLVVGKQALRFQVLRSTAGVFLCREGETSTSAHVDTGDDATWYPVWTASLKDEGFGPIASETVPVAHAQVAVRAVRRISSVALASAISVPLLVTAVDLTPAVQPTINSIAFDPDQTCVRLASRADWYGRSRFTLTWVMQPFRQFIVYRALGDEINRLDRLEHAKGGRRTHNFPAAADWPASVYADPARRARVIEELGAINEALSGNNLDSQMEAIEAAYSALTIDTQMLLARQEYAWPAFVAIFGEPIMANSYEDVLDGKSQGHWFYRVTSRTPSGIESTPSEVSPPICCPDVVAPAAPLVHMALAGEGSVTLRWLASPDEDTEQYAIYSFRDEAMVSELKSMAPITLYKPTPHVSGTIVEFSVPREAGEWCFWIVAVDRSGNASGPSAMLRGKSLRLPPEPPEWVSAELLPSSAPTLIRLKWRHATDQRLACLIERRPVTEGYWANISGWLPRGSYQYDDTAPSRKTRFEYRLRVRDQLGQVAAVLPIRIVNLEHQ